MTTLRLPAVLALTLALAACGGGTTQAEHSAPDRAEGHTQSSAGLPAGNVEAGGKLATTKGKSGQACADCHGRALMGAQTHFPALLGLPADYLTAQLGGWKTGQRRAASPDCMARIAERLSDADAFAVVSWLASQPVPAHTQAADARPASRPLAADLRCGSAPVPTGPSR